MTNRLATVLALLILAFIAADALLNGAQNLVFLGKKLYEFVEWLAFWR